VNTELPGIVVTGASGFIGRHFLASAVGKYRVFCLARRSRREVGIPENENQRWTQVDIARWDTMRQVVRCIKDHGGADYVIHLAGYYDFHNMEHPEYDRTNVQGTRNVLKLARQIGCARFVFASSLAACEFPGPGEVVTEDSLPHAKFAYARSKRRGEDMVLEHVEYFPATTLRLAAVYSDWCEYPPLYKLLETWLGKVWNSRILGGRGDSAVTYIHIQDVLKLLHLVIERNAQLPRFGIYNVSPSHTTSHRDLYSAATNYHFDKAPQPICLPKWIAGPGVCLRYALGRLLGRPPFEAPWMVGYIDKELRVDASRTHQELGWKPTERLDVRRRLLFMIENMKSQGGAWHLRNQRVLVRIARRPNFVISYELEELRDSLVEEISDYLTAPIHREKFCRYHEMPHETLLWFITLVHQILVTSVRTGDRQLFLHYAQVIASRRKNEGFAEEQVHAFLKTVGRHIEEALLLRPALAGLEQEIHDNIALSFQLAADGISDVFDGRDFQGLDKFSALTESDIPTTSDGLAQMVTRLEDICEDALPDRLRKC
jgi:nucleoside-diphosphate-sugar epimerase